MLLHLNIQFSLHHLLKCCSHTSPETNSLKNDEDSGGQFITPAGPRQSPLSQGRQPTFVKALYTFSVRLKPTSPNSLNLAWNVLTGDTIRWQPWFIIRRVSWLNIAAYSNGCRQGYKGDWLHRGSLHSFWWCEILVWNLVFISLGGLFFYRFVTPMSTRHIVQSSLGM